MSDPLTLGVDIGGTSTKWAVLNGGLVEATGSFDTPRVDHAAVIDSVAYLVSSIEFPIAAVGVAVPGTVDPRTRRTVFIPNLPGEWRDLPVAERLEESTGLPVAISNDARAFAWAELTTGAAEGRANALFVTLGTGVGGAIAFRGEILLGRLDSIGEIGHVRVGSAGQPCGCGGRGCLETVASASAITGSLARPMIMGQSPILRDLTHRGEQRLTAKIAAEAARMGDPWALDAFERAGDAIGQAVASIALMLQLDTVVIGGGLRPAADLYLHRVQEALNARTSLTGEVTAVTSVHGHEAGSIGAATLAAARLSHPSSASLKERTH